MPAPFSYITMTTLYISANTRLFLSQLGVFSCQETHAWLREVSVVGELTELLIPLKFARKHCSPVVLYTSEHSVEESVALHFMRNKRPPDYNDDGSNFL